MKQALFPLNTVVFPGSILTLKIFEQRYLNLITQCLKQNTGFTIVNICKGSEVGTKPQIHQVGCVVDIIDWDTLKNGLFSITVQTKQRVRLTNNTVCDDGLLLADTEEFPLSNNSNAEQHLDTLVGILLQLLKHPYTRPYKNQINFNNLIEVCFHLSNLLPLPNQYKQLLLESEDTQQLIEQLRLFDCL